MKGDQDDPFTHDSAEFRGQKWCKCRVCGVVAICTPEFDFWSDLTGNGPLRCDSCFDVEIKEDGLTVAEWLPDGTVRNK